MQKVQSFTRDKHPAAKNIVQSAKVEPKFKIHVPKKGNIHKFVTGGWNLRTIERKRLDRTGKTHVRTVAGARVLDVTASLKACYVRDDVRRVVLHVRGNDVHKYDLKADYR